MAIFGTKDSTGTTQPETSAPARTPGEPSRVSRLGEGIAIKGKIEGSETLRLDGRLEGEIDLKADLIIGPSAEVHARVHARTISIEGRVDGDISADQKIDLIRTARVEGTLKAPAISVAEGASFEGKIDMSMRKSSSQGRAT